MTNETKSLKEAADALLQAGHDFWKACRREAGGGAVRWLHASDGSTIIFTRGEYSETLLDRIAADYKAPEVVFEQEATDDERGITACVAPEIQGKLMNDREKPKIEPFVVRHYAGDARPIIKGNGFDGLEIGESREEAQRFVDWINAALAPTP